MSHRRARLRVPHQRRLVSLHSSTAGFASPCAPRCSRAGRANTCPFPETKRPWRRYLFHFSRAFLSPSRVLEMTVGSRATEKLVPISPTQTDGAHRDAQLLLCGVGVIRVFGTGTGSPGGVTPMNSSAGGFREFAKRPKVAGVRG
jgi:hypothetical protein